MHVYRRFGIFNVVGFLGIGIQFAMLFTLRELVGLHILAATAVAVESAVVHNFIWHEFWTWADRISITQGGFFIRLLRFNLSTGMVSIGGNLVFMSILVQGLGIHYLIGNAITIGACAILNFLASDRFVFGTRSSRDIPALLKLLVRPMVKQVARESMQRTLDSMRKRYSVHSGAMGNSSISPQMPVSN